MKMNLRDLRDMRELTKLRELIEMDLNEKIGNYLGLYRKIN